jgi:putative thiamine transport system substrate-binding protein
MALSFNPLEATAGILADELPKSTRTAVFDGGTIANANFVAIPFNSGVKEGAMVFANFLMSPEAQARKQDPEYWGGLTVLDVADLPPAEKARFDALDLGEASLTPDKLGPTLAEPHPSWAAALEKEWLRRYGSGG